MSFAEFTRTEGVDTAYFMYGRFNPPTKGHGELFKLIADATIKKEEHKPPKKIADAFVFVGNKITLNGPLPVEKRMKYIKKLYGNLGITFIDTKENNCTQIPEGIQKLLDKGYTKLTMYMGSDYKHGRFDWVKKYFPDIPITIKITDRAIENGVIKTSATKARAAARAAAQATKKDRKAYVIELIEQTGLTETNAEELIQNIKAANNQGYPSEYSIAQASKKSRKASNPSSTYGPASAKRQGRPLTYNLYKRQYSKKPNHGGYKTRKSKK